MKRAPILTLILLTALCARVAGAGNPPSSGPIVLEAEDAAVTRMPHTRSRLMDRVPHSGRAYWALYGAGEQLTFRFAAPAGQYFVWVRAWLDPREATARRRLGVYLANRLIGYLEQGNDRAKGNWTWHRLGPAALPGGMTFLRIKKPLNSPRPAAVDVIHLSRDPRYRPPGR